MPDALTADLLIDRYPKLYHMAEADSWPSVERHGLLSTSALLDLFEIEGAEREQLEGMRRPASVLITHPVHGTACIRDNLPIIETVLRRTLEGMTLEEWYRTLNARVFFWVSESRVNRLRAAPPYRDRRHDIIILDTAMLLERHAERVELAHLNTGATHPAANYPRGAGTFQPIAAYPWAERRRVNPREPLVELTVQYAVPDVDELLIDRLTR